MDARKKLTGGVMVAVIFAVWAAYGVYDRQDRGPAIRPSAAADHHIHIRTPEAALAIGLINTKLGDMETDIIQRDMPPVTAQDAIAELDKAGIEQGVLLSVGYFFGMPEYDGADEYDLVRRENDYTVAQAALFPDRLIALCSVNPLKDYAVDEVGRCARELKSPGIKLNLSAVDVDFRKPGHVEKLRAVFRAVHANHMGVAIHMRSRNPDFGPRDVEIFVNEILVHTPGLPLHIAHLGGWGGYDRQTDAALGTWIDMLDDGAIVDRSHVTFDIAAIIFEENSDQDNRFALNRLKAIGLGNIIFATDWSYLYAPAEYQALLYDKMTPDFSEDEISLMMSNKAHYFKN